MEVFPKFSINKNGFVTVKNLKINNETKLNLESNLLNFLIDFHEIHH